MATPEKFLPADVPIAEQANGWRVSKVWLMFFQHLVTQAASAGNAVASGVLTAHRVLVGDGTNKVKALGSSGTSGQVLTSNGAGSDPSWQPAATGTGTVTNTGTLTDHAVILGNSGVDVQALSSLGTSGQLLQSQGAGADPIWATVSSGGGSWIPAVDGSEPPTLVSDGMGNLVLVAYP